MATGLTTMTGHDRGGVLRRASAERPECSIGSRVRSLTTTNSQSKQLPTDADGKLRDVSVKVNRPDVSVRTRQSGAAREERRRRAERSAPGIARHNLSDIADLPIAVASYTTRGEEPASLRVLLSAEFGTPIADWAFAVFDRNKVIADGRQQSTDEVGKRLLTTSLQLAPGRYRIRVAAAASDGRAGVIDAPLNVGLRAAAPLQLSDVILGTCHQRPHPAAEPHCRRPTSCRAARDRVCGRGSARENARRDGDPACGRG